MSNLWQIRPLQFHNMEEPVPEFVILQETKLDRYSVKKITNPSKNKKNNPKQTFPQRKPSQTNKNKQKPEKRPAHKQADLSAGT